MDFLLDALEHAWRVLGFDQAASSDEVFRDLVLARVIEPVSKLDSLRVLEEAGVVPDREATPAGLCGRFLAWADLRSVRRACRAGPGQPGPLRCEHLVFRDRRQRRVR
jgi:hypothetical protein